MKTRLSLLMILALLAALFATPATRADGPVTGQAPSEAWLITWEASTEGNATDGATRITRQSRVTASIVVNYYSDGTSDYYANEYTATYLHDDRWEFYCSYGGRALDYTQRQLLNPARYDGTGPVKPNGVMPWKPIPYTGTQWILPALNLSLGGFTIASHFESQECGGPLLKRDERDPDSLLYLEYLPAYTLSGLISDDDGVFRYDADTQVQLEDHGLSYPLRQKEHLTVERLAGRDLRVHEIEVTQGLQLHNTIPLVQGRQTIVRAYIDIGTEPGPIANVTGRLRAYDGEALLGELAPFNIAGSISAKSAPDWHKVDDTLNFELPFLWTLAPSLRLEAEVNHTKQVSEMNYANNTRSVELSFRNCEPITIGYLPVRFAPPGVTPAGPGADIARGHEFLRKVYPVADVELFYEPWPGFTWTSPIDAATESERDRNSSNLLDALFITKVFNNRPEVDKLIGWLPASASVTINGEVDEIPGEVAWVAQKKVPNYWRGTFAHEVGHTYGLKHNSMSTNGYHWFDVYERSIKPPRADGNLLAFISTPGAPEEERWVSPDSYRALFKEFCPGGTGAPQDGQAQAAARTAADVLVVSGNVSLTATQAGQLQPLYRIAGTELIPSAGTQYYVVLRNGNTELSKYGFDAEHEVEATKPYTPTIAPFALAVPYPAGLTRVDLTDANGQVLNSRVASAHPPTVAVQFPNAAGLTLDGVETIQWAGSDPDGDALTYSVLYSKDNGVTWNAIGAGIAETSYAVDFAAIPGSAAALIKVLASDGFETASDISDQPFTVPAKPPVAAIVSPPAGAHFKVGEQIKLHGYAVDLEEGTIASDSLSWSSDLDGALGAGGLREVTLSEGTHTITLDVRGGAASATTTVVVRAPPPPPKKSYMYLPLVLR